jgi:hypothetical protein
MKIENRSMNSAPPSHHTVELMRELICKFGKGDLLLGKPVWHADECAYGTVIRVDGMSAQIEYDDGTEGWADIAELELVNWKR